MSFVPPTAKIGQLVWFLDHPKPVDVDNRPSAAIVTAAGTRQVELVVFRTAGGNAWGPRALFPLTQSGVRHLSDPELQDPHSRARDNGVWLEIPAEHAAASAEDLASALKQLETLATRLADAESRLDVIEGKKKGK